MNPKGINMTLDGINMKKVMLNNTYMLVWKCTQSTEGQYSSNAWLKAEVIFWDNSQ